jgi:hypothetical protein
MLVHDRTEDAAALRIEKSKHVRADQLTIEMRVGGGFIGRFSS